MAGPGNDHKKMTREASFAYQVQNFDFCGESIDTSLRKLLAKVLLPKEAQQIDRAMEDFAKRYYECNPGLVDNPDVVYAVSFSILLLHTDAHNKNVRQKMNKDTFIMRTKIIEGGEGVAQEILDVMYDNIVMSEFTYADGHKESIGRTERSNGWFSKLKNNDSNITTQSAALLADLGQKLEQLMPAENSFSYKRTLKPIPIMDVHFSLLKAKSLCLAGVRSRYGNDANHNNTFTIRVTKAGILDRKYDLIQGGKKATARGWRPFGIILSGSQIIFFADLSSYQTWLDKEENPSALGSKRNNSFPAFSSIVDSSSNLSVNNTTVNSLSSLYTQQQQQNTPIPHNSSSSTTSSSSSNSYLRPVQIVSLSYAICICDEEYTKYPHVFRLITGDGQQFLLRADNDKEMEDWMLKINYAATLKTTGVRMRPTRRDGDKLKREDKAKEKVSELSDRIDEQVKLLDRELQLRRNLMVLSPYQKSTKDRILLFAETLGKRIKTKRIELQRLICYRDYLESELSFSTCQQTRKLSLPTHLYPFPPNTTTTPPPRSSLVFTATTENEPISNQSTSTSSSHHNMMETSSAISQDDGEEVDANDDDDDDDDDDDVTPQLPSFSFPKSFIESLSFMDAGNVKTASDKAVEMDRMMRRRSQSNPVLPRPTIVVDKKLLLEPPHRRQRSGSEASSVKEDDDDMSVIIVNDSEELLTDPTWPITPTH
ncbi:uncharacterized protein EV154DRAFT_458791 [Mucor mucedo]|uniref:uncharacterized protein n=1 Tax=Mucor mucedo TaxID=29922 RepID=UPI00222074D0|nr:uncharacterized protein EV154DRAFT_458791 [Mucor mucedo]KAI7894894.1 hypothetical protein EV154DRAFT_458791 [Mucor mucedo]